VSAAAILADPEHLFVFAEVSVRQEVLEDVLATKHAEFAALFDFGIHPLCDLLDFFMRWVGVRLDWCGGVWSIFGELSPFK
jgi:hypothetical protein